MKHNKIPTIFALIILVVGIVMGVILIHGEQIFHLGADVRSEPKDLRISNITDHSIIISWVTQKETLGFVTWGDKEKSLTRTAFEETDAASFIHYISINQLQPNKNYFFEINSDHQKYDNNGIPWKAATGTAISTKQQKTVIAGSVSTKTGIPVEKAIIYTVVSGGSLLSTVTSDKGSWILDISQARNQNLDNYASITETSIIETTIQAGPLGMSSLQAYLINSQPLPPILLGETYDFKNNIPKNAYYLSANPLEIPEKTSSVIFKKDSAVALNHTFFPVNGLTPLVILSIISTAAILFCILIFYMAMFKEYQDRLKAKIQYAQR